jgi:phage terminase large subunit-like protein
MIGCPEIDEYIRSVREDNRTGEYPACKELLQFCDFVEREFNKGDIYVDTDQLSRYMSQQKWFSYKLFPWEKCLFALNNCTYYKDTPELTLRFPELFVLIGRGNGKNGYLSFWAFCMITQINNVDEYNIDIFATSEDQAQTSFNEIKRVLEKNEERLKKFFVWNKEVIRNKKTGSEIRFRTSNSATKDGLRPGAIVFDEKHQYTTTDLVQVAEGGLGKKPLPREITITTDGNIRGGVLDSDKERAKDVLERGMEDLGFLPFICKLDDEKEVDNERYWHKANPSLRYFPTLQREIKKGYGKYKINPEINRAFLTKRMNIPLIFESKSVTSWDNIQACKGDMPNLDFCECVAGVDYAKTTDFVSAGLLFKHNEKYYWKQHSWICEQSHDLPAIKAPIYEWAKQGYCTIVKGPEIHPDLVAKWLEDMSTQYNVTCLSLDNFRITLMAQSLKEHGFDTDKGGANNIRLTKRVTQNRYAPLIISLFNTHQICWGQDPMMGWYTNNACIEEDKTGNLTFAKKDPIARKTDGFMALVAAICASENLQDSADEGQGFEDFYAFNF